MIEKRIAEIDDYIDKRGLTGKLDRLLHGNIYWHWHEEEKEWQKNSF